MGGAYDLSGFYGALSEGSSRLLRGIDDDTREIISLVAGTDSFWSNGLEELLAERAAEGDLRSGVLAVLGLWRENVLSALSDEFGLDLDWESVKVDDGSPLIGELVDAAKPS